MSELPTHINFRTNVQHVPAQMPVSVRKATTKFLGTRANVINIVGDERWESLREAGHNIRLHTLENLDYYLAQIEFNVTQAGGIVHWARDAKQAREIVLEIAQEHHVQRIVKAKSMATEEIGLNHALEHAGIQVTETDLGEFIIQLANETPSHIIVPAVHKTKEGIAELFHDKLKVDAPPDPIKLCEIARDRLREEFLAADMGISGANFMVAETGTIVIVTNEGNGRMSTTLPPVHVAVVGIDKAVPDLESLNVLLKLLPRSATGQKMSSYVSFVGGPRKTEQEHGPKEFHLVLMDNGRTKILQDPRARETLLCIRCGVCANVCPVYNDVGGGHAYGWVYSGPIGAMLAPQLLGTKVAGDLPFASSLCGACADYCPVKIPIPNILLHLRHRVVQGDAIEQASAPSSIQNSVDLATQAFRFPWVYELGTQMVKALQSPVRRGNWLPNLPPPMNRWTMVRPLSAFGANFRTWFRNRKPQVRLQRQKRNLGIGVLIGSITAVIAALVFWNRKKK